MRRGRRALGTTESFSRPLPRCLLLVGLLPLFDAQPLHAQPVPEDLPPPVRSLSLVIENDLFVGEDSQYTSGVGLVGSFGPVRRFSDGALPDWLAGAAERTWLARGAHRQRARTYSLAQTMQTPEDIGDAELQPDDMPYAGLLLGEVILYAFDDVVTDRLALALGVVGPLSFGEESQKLIHEVIDSDEPMGWDNQLENEPVFQVEASRGRRLWVSDPRRGLEFDAIGLGDVALGTVASHVSTSLVVRAGTDLVRSHAVASLLPSRQTNPTVFLAPRSWYAFVGAELRYVFNDVLIEGNTFTDSHSRPLEHRRERLAGGFSVNVAGVGVSFLYADVPGNGSSDAFGSLSLTWLY